MRTIVINLVQGQNSKFRKWKQVQCSTMSALIINFQNPVFYVNPYPTTHISIKYVTIPPTSTEFMKGVKKKKHFKEKNSEKKKIIPFFFNWYHPSHATNPPPHARR